MPTGRAREEKPATHAVQTGRSREQVAEVKQFADAVNQVAPVYWDESVSPVMTDLTMTVSQARWADADLLDAVAYLGSYVTLMQERLANDVARQPSLEAVSEQLARPDAELQRRLDRVATQSPNLPQLKSLKQVLSPDALERGVLIPAYEQMNEDTKSP